MDDNYTDTFRAWKYVEDWYLEGLEPKWIEKDSVENLLSCYEIGNTGKKIFWTYHPQALCRKSVNLDELIGMIKERF